MTLQDLESQIRNDREGIPSLDSLVALALAMYRDAMVPSEDNSLKKKHLDRVYGDVVDVTIDTCLDHLVNINIVDEWVNGGDWLIINERRDEIVNDEDLEVLLRDETERLVDDLEPLALADGGGDEITRREVVAEALGVGLDEIEEQLVDDEELWDWRENLETAIEAIEDEETVEKGGDYAPIRVIRNPYRYELTEWAVELAEA
ncbi:hypothetical protein [Halorussus caseinilyticus]|uniref:hypothetical protein n=1 Tax=Halorussus caseinilyticus TaxID=3034025 RepID=UPI0023E8053B|nr:hypothetical protein [Halorussus sp. DT72]